MGFGGRFPFLILLLVLFQPLLHADDYPERTNLNTDVIYLDDPRVDAEVRLNCIRKAKHSIEVVAYKQGFDEHGARFLGSLREAQKKGIHVRYLFEHTGSLQPGRLAGSITDGLQVAELISDSSLPHPGDVICGRIIPKLKNGMGLTDFIHEKILIIDRGTPDEVIFIGGRSFDNFSLKTLDSAFLIRPVDPSKPYLGTDLSLLYQRLWSMMSKLDPPYPKKPVREKILHRLSSLQANPQSKTMPEELPKELKEELNRIMDVVNVLPKLDELLAPFQFRPHRAQLFTNDLIRQVVEERPGRSLASRESLQNSIEQELIRRLRKTMKIDLSSFAFNLPRALKEAIILYLRDGGELRIFTNGIDSQKIFAPGGTPAYLTLERVSELMEIAEKAGHADGVKLYFLKSEPDNPGQFNYLHRKMILSEGVGTGSDNLTRSSALKNSELMVFFDDPRMENYFRRVNDYQLKFYSEITHKQVRALLRTAPFMMRCLYPALRGLVEELF